MLGAFAMPQGVTMPLQPLAIPHALTAVTMACLVQPHNPIDAFDRTPGSHHPPQHLFSMLIGLRPLG